MTLAAVSPTRHDVLLGRGHTTKTHPGNVQFRRYVDERRANFLSARKHMKRIIAQGIVDEMKSKGIRFLVEKTGDVMPDEKLRWFEVDYEKAVDKVMHRLRAVKDISRSQSQTSAAAAAAAAATASAPPTSSTSPAAISCERRDDLLEQLEAHTIVPNVKGPTRTESPDSLEISSLLKPGTASQWDGEESEKLVQFMSSLDTRVVSLRDWIVANHPGSMSGGTANHYIKDAIRLAIKVAELCLANFCEFDIDRLLLTPDGDEPRVHLAHTADRPWASTPRDEMKCLTMLGYIFLEMFTGRVSSDAIISEQGKSSKPPSYQLDAFDNRIGCVLDSEDLPFRLRFLLKCLVQCTDDTRAINGAYRSVGDVLEDLRLMNSNPSCYLEDLYVTGTVPIVSLPDKLYGRDGVILKMASLYNDSDNCRGLICQGKAGVGKSALLTAALSSLAVQTGSYFFMTKFNQQGPLSPLTNIVTIFDSLVDSFSKDSTTTQLTSFADAINDKLGLQVSFLAQLVPSLSGVLPHASTTGLAAACIDRAASVNFIFLSLLETISCYTPRIILLFDDVQFADVNSRAIMTSLLLDSTTNSRVFFACSLRDDEVSNDLAAWLAVIRQCPFEQIQVEPLELDDVNMMVSETLHTPPRLTRQLSSILLSKTRGNALFLREMLLQLSMSGLIYLKLNPSRWAWSIEKILMDAEMPNDVVMLLVREMQSLSDDQLLCLKIASCLGSVTKYSIFDVLSAELGGVDLRATLSQLTAKGFLIEDGERVRFSHDKVHQAAYLMMSRGQQIEFHKRFGLALSINALGRVEPADDETFFIAVNQINAAGPESLPDPQHLELMAKLNLKAGRRSNELSDHSSALRLFECGIGFVDCLPVDMKWSDKTKTALQLYVSAVETACTLNDAETVSRLSDEVIKHSSSEEDKLKCFYSIMTSLTMTGKHLEAREVAYSILSRMGENHPRELGDEQHKKDVARMVWRVSSITDDAIFAMKESNQASRDEFLLGVLSKLWYNLNLISPNYMADVNLRMLEITLENGICPMSPTAIVRFAASCLSLGKYKLAYRLSKLSLRIIERANANQHTSSIILWAGHCSIVSEPIQSVAETHMLGFRAGQQAGDVESATLNQLQSLTDKFLSGGSLERCRAEALECLKRLTQRKQSYMKDRFNAYALLVFEFIHGTDRSTENLPTWDRLLNSANDDFQLFLKACKYMRRIFLTKDFSNTPKDGLLDGMRTDQVKKGGAPAKTNKFRPMIIYGTFHETLFFLQLIDQSPMLKKRADEGMEFVRELSEISPVNFTNKYLLLEGVRLERIDPDQSETYYLKSIHSSRVQKTINDEALCSELAGKYFFRRGDMVKSKAFLLHAIQCYEQWGASAIVARMNSELMNMFGLEKVEPVSVDIFMKGFVDDKLPNKKRTSSNG